MADVETAAAKPRAYHTDDSVSYWSVAHTAVRLLAMARDSLSKVRYTSACVADAVSNMASAAGVMQQRWQPTPMHKSGLFVEFLNKPLQALLPHGSLFQGFQTIVRIQLKLSTLKFVC